MIRSRGVAATMAGEGRQDLGVVEFIDPTLAVGHRQLPMRTEWAIFGVSPQRTFDQQSEQDGPCLRRVGRFEVHDVSIRRGSHCAR